MKICFLTDRSPNDRDPFSTLIWNQIMVLAESQNEVIVVSHQRPGDNWPSHPRLQLIEPFPSWSLRYLPRFMQVLLLHRPDVLHWIEPRESGFSHLHWITPALATLRKRPLMAMSLWQPGHLESRWGTSATLAAMDLLFVCHPYHREMIWRRWPQMMSRVQIAPLLFLKAPNRRFGDPSSQRFGDPSDRRFADLPSDWINTWADDFEIIPSDLDDMIATDHLISALARTIEGRAGRKTVIPMSKRQSRFSFLQRLRNSGLDGHVAIFESLGWDVWCDLMTRARLIRSDLIKTESPYLVLAIQWSRAMNRSIQISPTQAELTPELLSPDAFNFLGRAYQAAFKDREARLH